MIILIWIVDRTTTRVDDSGHWIVQKNIRNRWNMETVFRPDIGRIFSGGFLSNSCASRQEPAGNRRKKSETFLEGILLPPNHRNYPEPVVSGPGSSTWVFVENYDHLNQSILMIEDQ